MTIQFDHVFICVSHGGEEAAELTAFGLTEGAANTHPGQGTECRRFFFRNGYIELIWVSNSAEARSPLVQPTHLWDRWAGRREGACPFGLVCRWPRMGSDSLLFAFWEYRPPYLPDSWCINVAKNASVIDEPMLVVLPFVQSRDADANAKRPLHTHPSGLDEITRVELVSPVADKCSAELRAFEQANVMRLRHGAEHVLELGFDGEKQARTRDFRPALPLVIFW